MNRYFEKIKENIGYFKEIPTVASVNEIERNPIDESIKQLLYNPKYKTVDRLDYIAFGQYDDIDQVISILKNKSATHAGILNRKAKLVAGAELNSSLEGNDDWDAFYNRAGGKFGATLNYEWEQMANIYETYGGVGLLVHTDGKQVIKIEALSPLKFRVGSLNSKNEIDHYVIRNTFARGAAQIYRNTARKVPVFDADKVQKESFIYVGNPSTDNDFYAIPNYIGAFNFIEADYKFGVTINNSAENGFQPKVMATFVGRGMTQEQKEQHAEKLKENFQGAASELMIVNYVRKFDEMPKIDNLAIENLDRTIEVMANLNDAKILTAHSVTNPSLFGVMVSGKLGNTGTELESAYNTFMAAEAIPDRVLLLNTLTLAFKGTTFEDVEFTITDVDITPAESRGGDTTPAGGTTPTSEEEDTNNG